MLVSHSKKFIYMKTVKTAGTSVELALQKYCVPNGMVVHVKTDAVETAAGIVGARGSAVHDQKWRNHMTAHSIRNQLPGWAWDEYTKICNIRNPWDKTVSFFHMTFPTIRQESPEIIVAQFQRWLANTDKIGGDTNIYFINDKPVADEYIRYDRLMDDTIRIGAKLGLEVTALPQINVEYRDKAKLPYRIYYDEAGKQKVAEHYFREIGHFGWCFNQDHRP